MNRIGQFLRSFRHAARGIAVVARTEQSFRIQAVFGLVVLAFGLALEVRTWEFIMLVLLVGAVLTMEIVNSIFERLVDAFRPRVHPLVRDVKDAMAGGVLLVSLVAAIIGLIILGPRLVRLFWG